MTKFVYIQGKLIELPPFTSSKPPIDYRLPRKVV